MHTHITINGQTYASVNDMPPDVRRQYEAAIQLLSQNAHILAHAAPGDVNISTTTTSPSPHVFKTVTRRTTNRIVVNGKEYSGLEDVPFPAREALESAGAGSQMPLGPDRIGIPNASQRIYASSATISLSLVSLVVLLMFAVLFGVFIGVVGYILLH